jgi:tRNA(His) guanylyltransferase
MHNDTMEACLRVFENALDQPVPVEFQIIARLDGRSFTRLTKEICAFESPFDSRFRDLMATTCQHVMACSFNVLFAYSESDELSLLLHPADIAFSRKPRKLISILAGEASAAISVELGRVAAFDGRLSILPGSERVVDYFRWRMADAARCCLYGHAYWLLRRQGQDVQQASNTLLLTSQSDKHDLLFSNGINFDSLPTWQKRGFGVYCADVEKRLEPDDR